MIAVKCCTDCKLTLPLSAFYGNGKSKRRRCRGCDKARRDLQLLARKPHGYRYARPEPAACEWRTTAPTLDSLGHVMQRWLMRTPSTRGEA
jgi:hypothetical protein